MRTFGAASGEKISSKWYFHFSAFFYHISNLHIAVSVVNYGIHNTTVLEIPRFTTKTAYYPVSRNLAQLLKHIEAATKWPLFYIRPFYRKCCITIQISLDFAHTLAYTRLHTQTYTCTRLHGFIGCRSHWKSVWYCDRFLPKWISVVQFYLPVQMDHIYVLKIIYHGCPCVKVVLLCRWPGMNHVDIL